MLQQEAANLLPFERVSECLRRMSPLAPGVGIHREAGRERCRYSGLKRCLSVWHCPMCAWQITEGRRRELELAIFAARDQGLAPRLVTYTCRHHRWTELRPLVDGFTKALHSMTQGRAYMQLRQALGVVGFIRSLEVTYGGNGWHPHCHQLLFLPAEVSTDALTSALWPHWFKAATRHGLEVDAQAFDVRDTHGAVGDYIAKYGHDPVYDVPWGVSSEMTRWHIKRGRGGSRTALQLLGSSADGDRQASALYREYASVFKGRRQLYWSNGLEDTLGICRKPDAEFAEPAPDDELLGLLSSDDWRKVRRHRARGELLEVAAVGGWSAVAEWLAAHD